MQNAQDEDQKFSFGIGMKLILTATLVMSVTVATVGTLLHRNYVESLQEIEMDRLEGRAQELTNDLSDLLDQSRDLAFDLASLKEIRGYSPVFQESGRDSETAKAWMQRMKIRVPIMLQGRNYVSSVHFIDFRQSNNEFFVAEKRGAETRVLRPHEFQSWTGFNFPTVSNSQFPSDAQITFSPSLNPLLDHEMVVTIPLQPDRKNVFGVVAIKLNTRFIHDSFSRKASKGDVIHLAYQDGTYITKWSSSTTQDKKTPATSILDIFPEFDLAADDHRAVRSGIFEDIEEHGHAIGIVRFALRSDHPQHFILAYSENFDKLIENTSIAPSRAIIAATAILLAAVILIGYFANRLTNPLRYIAKVARHYGESDEPAPLPVQASGEVGIVARSLHKMREQVEKRAQALTREIDAHKATSKELEIAMEETKDAAKAKSDFLATMSHEIRTPMNGVLGMADLLSHTELTQDQRNLVKTICASGDSLLTIINDILDFSKIESGKMELESEPLDPGHIVEEAIDLLSSNFQNDDIELIVNIAPDTPSGIKGDTTRLRQILLNLIGNAQKFTKQGEIEVGIRVIEDGGKENTLQFYIRDTGIGIPEEKQSKLFKAFSQVDSSTTRQYGGTGLGLAISSRLVKLMGGEIWVESENEKGSTFNFTIRAERIPFEARPLAVLSGKSGLIIDSVENHANALKNAFIPHHVHTFYAPSKVEALDCMRQNENLDFIITNRISSQDIQSLFRHANLAQSIPVFNLLNREQALEPSVLKQEETLVRVIKPASRTKIVHSVSKYFSKSATQTAPKSEPPKTVNVLANQLPLRILIADDNATNQYCAHELLSRLGYDADIADNGEEALSMTRAKNYDVIFMDVRMPIMDGLESTEKIRLLGKSIKQPHVIALTANAMPEDRDACHKAGMNDFVAKPILFDNIKKSLSALEGKEALN